MKTIITAAAFAAATIAAPAFAQTEAGPNTGARIEGTVGWDHVVLDIDGDSGSKSGVTYGGEIGYDVQLGGAVVGAYAGIDGASTKQCATDGTARVCIRANRNLTVGARVGANLGIGSLAYIKGGYSNGGFKASLRDSAFPVNNVSASDDLDGFHLGAGVEVGLSRNFYGKVEYNYTNYSTGDDDFNSSLDRHRVVAGVGIRF